MKVTAEKAEHSQVVLNVEMEPTEVEKSLEEAYRHLVLKANIPGFRKGKAPRPVLERHLGKRALLEHALEHLVPDACHKAIEQQKVEVIAEPQVEITSMEPVAFKATVPVRPTVKLCDYSKIRVESQPASVTEGQVDAAIEQLRQRQAVWTPVDRPVRYNDVITMSIASCVGDREILNEKEAPYRVMKDFEMPLPGFPEKLEGATKGEQRNFNLVFPQDHPAAAFRGQECQFKVTVNEIKEQSLPAVDEAFAKSLGADVETVDALREKVKADLLSRADAVERGRYEDAALQKLVECAQIEYPPILLEAETDRMVNQEEERAKRSGQKFADYLKAANKTMEQAREELRPMAENRLLRSLVLGQLADDEKIEVTPEEIGVEVEKIVKDAGDKAEETRKFLEQPAVRSTVDNSILMRKTIDRLIQVARNDTETVTTSTESAPTNEPATGENDKA